MISQKQLEANRNNAKLSTGPKTDAGKEHIKYNALKHGFRAATFVLMPNEDPDEHEALVDDWLERERPATPAQEHLVRHAADLTWMIGRAKWQEGQLLYQQIGDAMAQAERARLDRNRDALYKLLPTAAEACSVHRRHPGVNRYRTVVETTADGCDRLLGVWQGLRASAVAGQPWDDEQEMHAVRLLGFGDNMIRDPAVLDVVVANRFVRDPAINKSRWSDGPCGLCFGWTETDEPLARKPAGIHRAVALMINAADREMTRLEGLLAERKRDGDLDVAEVINPAITHVIIDPGVDLERTRRYRESLSRELLRTLDALTKLRKEEDRCRKEMGLGANKAKIQSPTGVSDPRDARTKPFRVLGAGLPNLLGVGLPDPAHTADRRSPEPTEERPSVQPGSGDPRPADGVSDPRNGANEPILTRRQRRLLRRQELEAARQARRSGLGK